MEILHKVSILMLSAALHDLDFRSIQVTIDPAGKLTNSTEDKITILDNSTALFDETTTIPDNTSSLSNKQALYNNSDYAYYYDGPDTERVLIDNSIWVTSAPGVICNTITIVVVSRMKPFTIKNLFMLILGITDLANVIMRMVSALTFVLEIVTDYSCKIMDYFIITSFNYSNMILVCWTVERFIAVWFPIKYFKYCTIKNTTITLAIAGIAMAALAIPYPIEGYAKQTDYGFVECEYSEFLYSIWTPIETTYYIWIPMLVIGVSNALIVKKVVANRKSTLVQFLSSDRANQRSEEQRQMTNILMSVSLAFLFLHIPQAGATIFLSIRSGSLQAFLTDPFSPLKSLLWCFIITEFQNSINFFLYCLTGRDFRAHVGNMICKCKTDGNSMEPMPKSTTPSTRETMLRNMLY